jgi:hypothetical protein
MGGPTLTRAALAAGTMGMSEVPRQLKSASDVVVGAAKGDPAGGFKAAGESYTKDAPSASEAPALGTPPVDTSVQDAANADAKKTSQEEEARRLRGGAGRASTILTSGSGLGGSGRRYLGSA